MSYVSTMNYRIIPTDTFRIIRGCAGCGCKQTFVCKGSFRVNANGSRLDAWLIYGCEKCGHTYNLPIFERVRPERIPQEQYQKMLSNDKEEIFRLGTNKSLFLANHAKIAWDQVAYHTFSCAGSQIENQIIQQHSNLHENDQDSSVLFRLHNPYGLQVRPDKIVADILELSRSKIKRLIDAKRIIIKLDESPEDNDQD